MHINFITELLQTEVTIVKAICDEKFICKTKSAKYVVWCNNTPSLFDYIINYSHTPKIINVYPYVVQEWYENHELCSVNDLSPDMLADLHKIKMMKITDNEWLKPIDLLWSKVPLLIQNQISKMTIGWPEYRAQIPKPSLGNICHGDIHPGNIIKHNNEFYLVDWDWLCIAPREFDIAMLQQYMSNLEFELFLEKYPLSYNIELVNAYYALCLYRCSLWAFSNTNSEKIPSAINVPNIECFREQLLNNKFNYTNTNLMQLGVASMNKFSELRKGN